MLFDLFFYDCTVHIVLMMTFPPIQPSSMTPINAHDSPSQPLWLASFFLVEREPCLDSWRKGLCTGLISVLVIYSSQRILSMINRSSPLQHDLIL